MEPDVPMKPVSDGSVDPMHLLFPRVLFPDERGFPDAVYRHHRRQGSPAMLIAV